MPTPFKKKKPNLRDQIREQKTTLEADFETGKKILEYRTTVELTGEQVATLQNVMSYMMTDGLDIFLAISPSPTSMLSTLDMVQKELIKMVDKLDIELPQSAKVKADYLKERVKKAMEDQ